MRRLLVCLALAALAGPAYACVNDMELPAEEREFRSQYRGPATPPPPASPSPSFSPSHRLLFVAGGALFLGALTLTWTGRRARD